MRRPLGRVLIAPTTALWGLPGLRGYFPDAERVDRMPSPYRRADAVLGWDRGRGVRRERALARIIGATFIALDDGLICSISGPDRGARPISLLADPIGRHFDATRPSTLEAQLEQGEEMDGALLDEARRLMAFKREHGLARYNPGVGRPDARLSATVRRRVLVVDQAQDDPSIALSLASPDAFQQMIAAARLESPQAQIVVLRPPSGRRSALGADSLRFGDVFVDGEVDVMALIEQVEAVYVVSSLIGLDAVLAGRSVVCFGAPFYAGWGLTDDRCPTPARRTKRLSIEALFAGAYLLFPRYVDPLTGEACSPRLAFERLAVFKRHAGRVAGHWIGLNIPPPKHTVLKSFLAGPRSAYVLSPRWSRIRDPDTRLLAWASKPNDAVRVAQREAPQLLVNIEDGFLRSVGLGSNFHPASSLVLDRGGIYYDPSTESDLERILNQTTFDEATLEQAKRLRANVVDLGLSKYNLSLPGALRLEGVGTRRTILVPGQVEDDASVLTGGLGLSNLTLLRTVRERHPQAFILFKEHPDVSAGNRLGRIPETEAKRLADLVVRDLDIVSCIDVVDEVHTLTSLTGFEALLRRKRVFTYGAPFYGGWGLTEDTTPYPRPRRQLTLDELVAGALLIYPLYLDPISRLPCDAETFVGRLQALRAQGAGAVSPGFARSQLNRAARATVQAISGWRSRGY